MTDGKTKICGKEVGLAYCIATEQGWEEMSGRSIGELDTGKQRDLLMLLFAGIVAYYQRRGGEIPVTVEDLLYEARVEELVEAIRVFMELRKDWYHVSEVEQPDKGEAGGN